MTGLEAFTMFGSVLLIPFVWAWGFSYYKNQIKKYYYWHSYYERLSDAEMKINYKMNNLTKAQLETLRAKHKTAYEAGKKYRHISKPETFDILFAMCMSVLACSFVPLTAITAVVIGVIYICNVVSELMQERLDTFQKTINSPEYWRSVQTSETALLVDFLDEIEAIERGE